MNEWLQAYARNFLKEWLAKCTDREQAKFKQIYAKGNLGIGINQLVDEMDFELLDVAMQQVYRTANKDKEPQS